MNHPDYDALIQQAEALIRAVPHRTANLANLSALLNQTLTEINWVGFYLVEGDRLVLGPFQGKPACIEIPIARGVCGAAVRENKAQLVKDVHAFCGHIACDGASRSELVVPLHAGDRIVGVLDLDSPALARFTEEDRDGMTLLAQTVEPMLFSNAQNR